MTMVMQGVDEDRLERVLVLLQKQWWERWWKNAKWSSEAIQIMARWEKEEGN